MPADQSTIEAGIDAAINGDTVLVQQGTYVEYINFNGKNITVGSLFLTTNDTSYISQTVIDGNGAGSVVTFQNGENGTAVLSGITITNGNSTFGAGILCENASSPTLNNLRVIGNNATGNGGGIFCSSGSNPTILRTVIQNNYATGIGDKSGGGGGGICCLNSSPRLVDVIIYDNQTGSGGIYPGGGGLRCEYSSPILENVIISKNSSPGQGGGVFCIYNSNPVFINTVINRNDGGGIFCLYDPNLTVINSILWNSTPDQVDYDLSDSISIVYSNIQGGWPGEGNISSNPAFINEIEYDYNLSDYSPSIGSGIDSVNIWGRWYFAPTTDIEGNPRPDPPGSNPDMGAYENPLAESIQQIVAISPTQNALNVSQYSNISVTFGVDMDPATINSATFVVHGSFTGKLSGTYAYDGPSKTATFTPDEPFKVSEQVSVTLTTGVTSVACDALVQP
ncbi:MAG: Ig-like domain-containing protein, partial [Candidatus Marinimicrobia bacterium]|nr:Ig-like domain-containing protein [Candidatus Neomarinimicrobiota bacterium]